jgi:glycosyltransferase involved in cell wall biosynthesis
MSRSRSGSRPGARDKSSPAPLKAPLITAAICTYNRYELLEKAIASLAQQSLRPNQLEILVIDNSSDPAMSRKESAKYKNIRNLRWIYEAIAGLSNARNVAAREAGATILAYLDDDAIAESGWAEGIVRTFEEFGSTCEVVGGRIRPIWSRPRPEWLANELLGYLSVVEHGDEARFLAEGEWVAGANIAYRTGTLLELGGFDVTLGRVGSGSALMSNEEVVLTEKIKKRGGRIVYTPHAAVDHLVEEKRIDQQWFRRRVAWQAVSECIGASTKAPAADLQQKWMAVKEYFLHCAPADRTVRALALEQSDPGKFRWQLATIYDFTMCVLGGLGEIENL